MNDSSGLPQGEEKRVAVQKMFDTIAPRYDLVNRIMTFRLDVRWRKQTIQALDLQQQSTVLDLACGTGDFGASLEQQGHTPVGIDLSYGMLAASKHPFPKVHGDLLCLPVKNESVEASICGFALRNLIDLQPFIEELYRVTKTDGKIAFLEVSEPDNAIIRKGHGFYFNTVVPKIGGLLSNKSAYEYLPKSVSYLPPPKQLLQMIENAGFGNPTRRQLTGGLAQLYIATK